ncbi:MAG: TetR/AcrR family transcriptional regulator [Candidatus Marinimicrobia bacterium]|nr:TetR/AcrR family transcriptional regulator [Candidatus Neomarinimicrobiota bacterium]MCF7904071.1 TetR/AcrR family transcriptional regulator [Candidatus Neomarinimicrobiota bacterium]
MMGFDRKEQHRQQQRQDILDAAEAVFAQQGYHKTTMDTVAESCGWSKGTLYLHFEHKEDLFFSILISKMQNLANQVIQGLKVTHSLEEILDTLLGVQFDFFRQNENFFQLGIAEQGKVMHGSSSGLREQMLEQQTAFIVKVTEKIAVHLDQNSPVTAFTFARALTGAINVHMIAWLLESESTDLDQIKIELKELFLNGILPYKKH